MPYVFGDSADSPRGCFIAFSFNGQNSKGALLSLPDGTLFTAPDPTYPLVVTGVSANFKETSSFLKCFNDAIYTYAFGGDVGSISINFLGFLQPGVEAGGAPGGVDSDPWELAFDAYKSARLSKSLDFATLTLGNTSVQGLVVGLDSATMDSAHSLQNFTVKLAYLPEK